MMRIIYLSRKSGIFYPYLSALQFYAFVRSNLVFWQCMHVSQIQFMFEM